MVALPDWRRDNGRGSAIDVSLAEAREAAIALRRKVREGCDPVAERRKARKVVPNFEKAARDCYEALKEGWKNRRHTNWVSSLENHVFPVIGKKPVDQVDSAAVLARCWTSRTSKTVIRARYRCAPFARGFPVTTPRAGIGTHCPSSTVRPSYHKYH